MTASAAAPPPAFSTPALAVELDLFEANVAAMALLLEGSGKVVRPHVKTHRTPELARRQLGGAVVGVTCATVGEAEAMVAAGIDDVLIANEVVDPHKLDRLAALARSAEISIAADSIEALEALSRAAVSAGVSLGVLIDVDVKLHRCGVTSIAEALALASGIERLAGLRLSGIMGYEGRIRMGAPGREDQIRRAHDMLAQMQHALVSAGHEVHSVSGAGTSTLREALASTTITEIQAGVYALMEPELLPMQLPFRCAAMVRATVISRRSDHVVLDAGRRSLGTEYGPPVPEGITAASVWVTDEHTILTWPDPHPGLGDVVDLVPSQIRTTFNLHDHVWVMRRGQLAGRWDVTARGRSS